MDLFTRARHCLDLCDVEAKLQATHALAADWRAGTVDLDEEQTPAPAGPVGRPQRPELVDARRLARRSLASEEGRAALIHAVAHIEFNAINLALDAAYRFRGLPRDYYADWLRVADEEARHFAMLQGRLDDLGYTYGDFPAHDGLWDMAVRTANDALHRMALVPRVLEARGLDVSPAMIERLYSAADTATAGILEVILAEEVAHVEIGTRWYRHLCQQRGLDPHETFFALIDAYLGGKVRGPFHHEARLRAGFTEAELARLEAGGKPPRS